MCIVQWAIDLCESDTFELVVNQAHHPSDEIKMERCQSLCVQEIPQNRRKHELGSCAAF